MPFEHISCRRAASRQGLKSLYSVKGAGAPLFDEKGSYVFIDYYTREGSSSVLAILVREGRGSSRCPRSIEWEVGKIASQEDIELMSTFALYASRIGTNPKKLAEAIVQHAPHNAAH